MKVVIIDDEQISIDRFKYLLGYFKEVEVLAEYVDPKKALEEIPALHPDIIFTDVEMPNLSGIELAQKLHEIRSSGDLVFITAYEQYAIKALRENALDYLLKPVDIDDLKACFQRFRDKTQTRFQHLDQLKEQYQLSPREIEILMCILKGQSSQKMAETLFISVHTANTHRRNILAKIGVESSKELIVRFSNHN